MSFSIERKSKMKKLGENLNILEDTIELLKISSLRLWLKEKPLKKESLFPMSQNNYNKSEVSLLLVLKINLRPKTYPT